MTGIVDVKKQSIRACGQYTIKCLKELGIVNENQTGKIEIIINVNDGNLTSIFVSPEHRA